MEVTANQYLFLENFVAFANVAWPHYQYARGVNQRWPHADVVNLMMNDAFFSGYDLAPYLQPALDCWNGLTRDEKLGIGELFGKELYI